MMNMNLTEAEKLLTVAAAYAGDGAIMTAIDRAREAIRTLQREQRRRTQLKTQAALDAIIMKPKRKQAIR